MLRTLLDNAEGFEWPQAKAILESHEWNDAHCDEIRDFMGGCVRRIEVPEGETLNEQQQDIVVYAAEYYDCGGSSYEEKERRRRAKELYRWAAKSGNEFAKKKLKKPKS